MTWEAAANGFTKEEAEVEPPKLATGPLPGSEPNGGKPAVPDPGIIVPPACKGDGDGADAGA